MIRLAVNKELVKGSTSILVLSLLSNEDMYGYQITQTLKETTNNVFLMKEGTLYPLLHSLENEKAIEAYWKDADNGKRRKYYHITKAGKRLLEEKTAEWKIYSNAVNTVIGGICYE